MKKYQRFLSNTFAPLAVVLAVALVFFGCDNNSGSGGGATPNPPTDIAVTYTSGGGVLTNDTIELGVDDEVSLTVIANGATAYAWEAEKGNDNGEVEITSGADSATVTVKGKTAGNATITAYASNADGQISAEIAVTVSADSKALTLTILDAANKELSDLELDVELLAGASVTLSAKVESAGTVDNDATVTWISNGTAVATVDDGEITGVAKGETTITVKAEKTGFITATKTINVTVNSMTELVLDVESEDGVGSWTDHASHHASYNFGIDDTPTLTVTGKVGGTAVDSFTSVKWEITEGTDVIEIDGEDDEADVVIKALQKGEAVITVTAEAAEAEDPVTLTIHLVVTREYAANVLFEWHHADNPITTFTGQGTKSWTHPDSGEFMNQGTLGKVTTVYHRGGVATANVSTNNGLLLGTTVSGARVVIGQSRDYQTAVADVPDVTDLGGQIDLYRKKVKLTIDYTGAAIVGTPSWLLRVQINANYTGAGDSMYSSQSNGSRPDAAIATYATVDALQTASEAGAAGGAGTLVLNIDTTEYSTSVPGGYLYDCDKEAGLAKAFITLHSQNYTTGGGSTAITITGIKLESMDATYVSAPPPVGLTFTAGGVALANGGEVALKMGDPAVQVTATTDPVGADVTWTSGTPTNATISTTGLVSAVAEGSSAITVKATAADHRKAYRTFTVKVNPATPEQARSGIIYQWKAADNDIPTGFANGASLSNTNTTLVGKTTGLSASQSVTNLVLRANNANSVIKFYDGTDEDEGAIAKGILVDGATPGGTGHSRLLFGSNYTTGVTSTTTFPTGTGIQQGQFDLRTTNPKVKVTINYTVLGLPNNNTNRDVLLMVNHNQGATFANTSPLVDVNSATANDNTPCLIATLAAADIRTAGVGSTGTLTGTINAADFVKGGKYATAESDNTAALVSLENAFFHLMVPGTTSAVGAILLITGFTVEYDN